MKFYASRFEFNGSESGGEKIDFSQQINKSKILSE